MNPLLKKEIRLLLPAWALTILLAVVPPFFFSSHENPAVLDDFGFAWLGVLFLCASSFGREFSLGTFSSLLAQPHSREKYWLTKVGVLVGALASVIVVCGLVSRLFFVAALSPLDAAWLAVLLLTGIAGGLWLALVIRQLLAVIWLVALIPGLLCLPVALLLLHFRAGQETVDSTMLATLFVYSVAGIISSWFIFRRAQDVPFSGGTLTVPEWLTAALTPRVTSNERARVPWRALIWKEIHFHQVLLFGMAGLFLLDLGGLLARSLSSSSDFKQIVQVLGLLPWALVPLVIGGSSIAEERKMGTMESLMCQPVSLRRQFFIKLAAVLAFGALFASVLPISVEILGHALGIQSEEPNGLTLGLLVLSMFCIALLGFFASSLPRSVLQALPLTVAMAVGLCFVMAGFVRLSDMNGSYSDAILWNPLLPGLVLAVFMPCALIWLAWQNFRRLAEIRRIWWRNGTGVLAALILTVVASIAIYHRAWESLTPFEPPHGVPHWSLADGPVSVRADLVNNMVISLPDGRFWFGCLAETPPTTGDNETWNILRAMLTEGNAPRLVIGQFIPGSDWASVAPGYVDVWVDLSREKGATAPPRHHVRESRQTVGIRSDGTLWVSEKPTGSQWNDSPLVQFGTDSDWKQVIGAHSLSSVLLLKSNGTLWCWGERTDDWIQRPSGLAELQATAPRRIGTNSDWQELFGSYAPMAQRKDGSLWYIGYHSKDNRDAVWPGTNLVPATVAGQVFDPKKASFGFNGDTVGIHADGTLWMSGTGFAWDRLGHSKFSLIRCSAETNWTSVALGVNMMVALKSDGTLWAWGNQLPRRRAIDAYTAPPVRLGIHDDWRALIPTWKGIIAVAADGSLWLWPDAGTYENGALKLIEPPDKPIELGNILAAK